jgi:hypothetical protein
MGQIEHNGEQAAIRSMAVAPPPRVALVPGALDW